MKQPDLLDRRQRHAAALLLSAIDLPAPAGAWARAAIAAAKVCPGIKITEVQLNSRVAALTQARDLIDEMLREAAEKEGAR